MKLLLRKIKSRQAKIDVLTEEVKELQYQAQIVCPHNNVSEGAYEPETAYSYHKTAFRVCEECGFTEEGYSFNILRNDRVMQISRDKAYGLRVGPNYDSHMFSRIGSCNDKNILYRLAINHYWGKIQDTDSVEEAAVYAQLRVEEKKREREFREQYG